MRIRTKVVAAGLLTLLGALGPHAGAAQAAEITVLASMGGISGVRDLAAGFMAATGHKVIASQEANVMTKVNAGAADIVTGGPGAIDNLIKEGKSNHIRNVVLTAQREGMQTLEVALSELIAHGVIDAEIGRLRSMYPSEIKVPVAVAANGEGPQEGAGSGRRSSRSR